MSNPKTAAKTEVSMEVDKQKSRNETEVFDPSQAFHQLKITEKDVLCKFVDMTVYHKKGVLLQFINMNSTGATTLIGGIRINVRDIRKLPSFLDRYTSNVREHAVSRLTQHMLDTHCATGVAESLCCEDYSLSFSVASLSEAGRKLVPMQRNEGPLLYCLCEHLVEPVPLFTNPDGTPNSAYVVNVYIHLLPASQRRAVVLKRHYIEEAQRRERAMAQKAKQQAGKNSTPGNGQKRRAEDDREDRKVYPEPPKSSGYAPWPASASLHPIPDDE
jgi:hypothetical protein